MSKKFKYDLEALEWDDDHRRNKEGLYCYCGLDYNDGDPMLRCEGCRQLFHWDCVACLKAKPLLGDTFYRFRCSVCCSGDEEYERDVLSWVQVIYIVLYHLIQLEPERSFFRWRENICATIGERWEYLFPDKTKTATWHNTVAGCLSTHTSLFKSGFEETKQTGNWTLHSVVEPAKAPFKAPTRARESAKPARREKAKRKTTDAEKEILDVLNEGKQGGAARRNARHRVAFSDDEDDDSAQRPRTKRRRAEHRTLKDDPELLQSFALFTQLERQRLDGTPAPAASEGDRTEPGSAKDATVPTSAGAGPAADGGVAAQGVAAGDLDDADVLDECSSLSSWASDNSESPAERQMDEGEDEPVSEVHWQRESILRALASLGGEPPDGLAQPQSQAEPAAENADAPAVDGASGDWGGMGSARHCAAEAGPTSLAGAVPCAMFSPDKAPPEQPPVLMSEREQWELCGRLVSSRAAMGSAAARRLHRRLELRRLRRTLGLRVFDIDSAVAHYMARPQRPWWPANDVDENAAADDDADRPTQGPAGPPGMLASPAANSPPAGGWPLAAAVAAAQDLEESTAATPYAHSFASRLMGRAVLRDSLTASVVRVSPFHGRRLRPFIWRDFQSMDDGGGSLRVGLPMLHVLRAIRARRSSDGAAAAAADRESIDYVHFQECHVPQTNALLSRTFWPGIDVSEALQYPEFSVVALYRRRVVGCAFLTPDAYVTYVAVAAGWEGAGIAKYMVYHLTRTLPTKDVTLHVSATNPAMLLYQQLGFKPETYVTGFYRDYLPKDSRACPHAFFMRLRRW